MLTCSHSNDFLPEATHLSAADKSELADVLGEAAWSHAYPACSTVQWPSFVDSPWRILLKQPSPMKNQTE